MNESERQERIREEYKKILEKVNSAFLYGEAIDINHIPELVVASFFQGMMDGMVEEGIL